MAHNPSPLQSLNRGLIQGLEIGRAGRQERRQVEAQKTLRDLQQRRIGIEERGVELRESKARLDAFSTFSGLLTNKELSKPERAGERAILLNEFFRVSGQDPKSPQFKALIDFAKATDERGLKRLSQCTARFAAKGGTLEGLSLQECQKQLLEIEKEERTAKRKREETKAGELFKTSEREAGTFEGRVDQAVESGVITQERADELKRQRFEKEATSPGPLVDLSGLAKKEQVKVLTKTRKEINEQKQAALTVVRGANRISKILGSDASPLAVVGFVARLGNSITEQARAIASVAGLSINPERYNFDAFPETAVKSVQVRTNVLSLAFAVARSREPGGRLSDRDVQLSLDSLAAGSGSTLQMRAALGEIVGNTIQNIDDFIAINESSFKDSGVSSPSSLADDLKKRGIKPLPRLEPGGGSLSSEEEAELQQLRSKFGLN